MPKPIITRLTPSCGWPGGIASDGSIVKGTLVIIQGNNFHPTHEMDKNQVSFPNSAGGRVSAVVEWASPNEIDYKPDGVVVSAAFPGGINKPMAAAIDSVGNLFLADTQNHRIIKRPALGAVTSWGSHGNGQSEFNCPSGITVDSNNFVYVADTMNHRIQKFDTDGNFISSWGSKGNGLGQFDEPVDIDVTVLKGMTFVYVADSNNHRVVRTDETGANPTNFLTPTGTGKLLGVSAPKKFGSVYATDPNNNRILKWTWNGIFNGVIGPPDDIHNLAVADLSSPMGIEQDFDGYVYVIDNGERVVKKFDSFDPTFRQIAQFGVPDQNIPGPSLPPEAFVDPVNIFVTNLKVAYVVDRNEAKVIRYTPTDSQEIWVYVPATAVGGSLEVRTDEGLASATFYVWEIADVAIVDAYLCQGLFEYPFVAGKKAIIRYQMRTVGESELKNFFWGSPITDSAICKVYKDNAYVDQIIGEPVFIRGGGNILSLEVGFEIHFRIPYWIANNEGNYRFEVTIDRTGPHSFHDLRSFTGLFHNRRRYNIISSPITHLNLKGERLDYDDIYKTLWYFGGDPQHSLDWMDWPQLYSGYYNYNRLFPVRYSMGDIDEWAIWFNDAMANGINSDDEVRDMLSILETKRKLINEGSNTKYDFMLGIVDRNEIHQNWKGITSSIHKSALISVGNNSQGIPAFDVGSIIGHELLHQHGMDHQSTYQLISFSREPWNSIDNSFVEYPCVLMFRPTTETPMYYVRNDHTSFIDAKENGSNESYETVFDALANPHPKKFRRREFIFDGKDRPRPEGSERNFNLIGNLRKGGKFTRLSSWIGSKDTLITPKAEETENRLIFLDSSGNILLSWPIDISYGLVAISKDEIEHQIDKENASISLTVPIPEMTSRVELIVDNKMVWTADVPTKLPIIKLVKPERGAMISIDDGFTIEWEASHPQRAELEYRVEYSFDHGKTYRPLAFGLREKRFEYPSGLAASSGSVIIRVVATDGFNQAYDNTDEIQVGEIFNRIVIIQPRYGERIPEGKPICLTAIARNSEQSTIDLTQANTQWILDDEITLGNGNAFEFNSIELVTPRGILSTPISLGPHRLRVEVDVSPNKKINHEIPIEIVADSDRDGIPDDIEREWGKNPFDPSDSTKVPTVYPFGQWQFKRFRTKTVFQISHLSVGNLPLELCFIDETGLPLSNYPIELIENGFLRRILTDNKGWLHFQLKSLSTILLQIHATKMRRKGCGTCRLRMARNSSFTKSVIQAHGWIFNRKTWWFLGWGSQGTVVINKGEPLEIEGAKSWSGFSPKMSILKISGYRYRSDETTARTSL
jgi:DNA-binding beta-propeller fold protein YncE